MAQAARWQPACTEALPIVHGNKWAKSSARDGDCRKKHLSLHADKIEILAWGPKTPWV